MRDRLQAWIFMSVCNHANSASYPLWDGKWVPAKVRWCAAARSKDGMAHSICG